MKRALWAFLAVVCGAMVMGGVGRMINSVRAAEDLRSQSRFSLTSGAFDAVLLIAVTLLFALGARGCWRKARAGCTSRKRPPYRPGGTLFDD
jgi:hypothetical protein